MNKAAQGASVHDVGAELPTLVKAITQEKIDLYANASGDHNPLHIDPAFAAETQFGGTVAHGMLVLAYLSEVMASAFGPLWTEGDCALKVRFRAPARPGDIVTVSGRVVAVEPDRTVCELEGRNATGELLISGQAEVRAG
jgi:3-hydroxybutyryl-CoA dehydratase